MSRVERKAMKNRKAMSRPGSEQEYGTMGKYERRTDELSFQRAQQVSDYFWRGVDPRRRIEMAEGGMVKEDTRAMANLSGTPIHTEYPRRSLNSYGFATNQLFDTEGDL